VLENHNKQQDSCENDFESAASPNTDNGDGDVPTPEFLVDLNEQRCESSDDKMASEV